MNYPLEELRRLLEKSRGAYVVTHRNADLDAYACGAAAKELLVKFGLRTWLLVPEGPSGEVTETLKRLSMEPMHDGGPGGHGDLLVMVDLGSGVQLGEYMGLLEAGLPKVLIDHHPARNLPVDLPIIDSGATSCSEVMALVARGLGIEPNGDVAALLVAGIVSDSGRLSRARAETFEALSWLLRISNRPYQTIIKALLREPSFPERMARVKGILRARAYRLGDHIACLTHVSAYESSVADALVRLGCDVALVASEHDDEVRVIGRCGPRLCGQLSLAEALRELGNELGGEGGGHVGAAALVLRGPRDLWRVLLAALEKISDMVGTRPRRISE